MTAPASAVPAPLTRSSSAQAEAELSSTDAILGRLIALHGPCPLYENAVEPFESLCRAIISQQLSARAAETIEHRVRALTGGLLEPPSLASYSVDVLRSVGLSQAKANALRHLAHQVQSGTLLLDQFPAVADEAVVECLTTLPGIGRWTAEMFLMFALRRPDVFARNDKGLRKSIQILYGSAEVDAISARWRPWRSVASWYLWQPLGGTASPVTSEAE